MFVLAKKHALALLLAAAPIAVVLGDERRAAGIGSVRALTRPTETAEICPCAFVAPPPPCTCDGSTDVTIDTNACPACKVYENCPGTNSPCVRDSHQDVHSSNTRLCPKQVTTWTTQALGTTHYAQAWETTEAIHDGKTATVKYTDSALDDVQYNLNGDNDAFAAYPLGADTIATSPGIMYVWTGQVAAKGRNDNGPSKNAPVTLSVVCPDKGTTECVVYGSSPECKGTMITAGSALPSNSRCIDASVGVFDHGMCTSSDETCTSNSDCTCTKESGCKVCPFDVLGGSCVQAKYGCSDTGPWVPPSQPWVCGKRLADGELVCGAQTETCQEGKNEDGTAAGEGEIVCSYGAGSSCPGGFTCLLECSQIAY